MSAGFLALCLNFLLVVVVSLVAPLPRPDAGAAPDGFELRPSVG